MCSDIVFSIVCNLSLYILMVCPFFLFPEPDMTTEGNKARSNTFWNWYGHYCY